MFIEFRPFLNNISDERRNYDSFNLGYNPVFITAVAFNPWTSHSPSRVSSCIRRSR